MNKWGMRFVFAVGLGLVLCGTVGTIQSEKEAQRIAAVVPRPDRPPTVVKRIVWRVVNRREIKMANYVVTGAGESGYNGTYVPAGTSGGAVLYQLDATHFFGWNTSFSWWQFSASAALTNNPGPSARKYVSSAGSISSVPTTGWITDGSGIAPAPTVTPAAPVNNGAGFFMMW